MNSMNTTVNKSQLSGWGGYRPIECRVAAPASRSALRQMVADRQSHPRLLMRGLGRSYGDSAVEPTGTVLLQNNLNRVRSFDHATGLLRCEAGVTLEDIIHVVLPHGWFLPTTPGTKFVTLGGAIAADVHGKNHHVDGTFGRWVQRLNLLLADGSECECSPLEHPELFWATIGGMGLTGVIVEAELQLRRCPSAYYHVSYRRCRNLDATLEVLAETDNSFTYSVGWIDCLGRGDRLGRSILMLGNDAQAGDLSGELRDHPFHVPPTRRKRVPLYFPNFALNRLSVSAFNYLYYAVHPDREVVVDYDSYFYPLDGIHDWNRIYGRRGFVQYQALFPQATAERGLRRALETLAAFGLASFLAVIKRSGPANPAPLSYLFDGYTLALDIPNVGPRMLEMARQLDDILLAEGGRLYLAKDSLMSPDTFRAMYPRLGQFLSVKRSVDPDNRFTSAQARRVGLLPSS